MKHDAKRPASEGERGAVLVETALVAGIILTFLLFSVQMGILGFLQVTADAASFVAARTAVLSTAPPGAYTAGVFSQVRASDVSSAAPIPAPTATVPVNYRYNAPGADPNTYQFQRVGGYSELQPVLQQVTVTPSKVLKIGGLTGNINGTDTEAEWTECGAHFNVAGSTTQCGSASAPTNFQTNYFSNGENTPPYYVGFNQMMICLSDYPWGYVGGPTPGVCPTQASGSPGTGFVGLGVAEYLDVKNWGRATAGALAPTDTFMEAGCHQAYYAAVAQFFNAYPALRYLYDKNGSAMQNMLLGTGQTNTPTGWTGYNDPAIASGNTSSYIQAIYKWDAVVNPSATLSQDQATPAAGCPFSP